jgi:hypothetical protein
MLTALSEVDFAPCLQLNIKIGVTAQATASFDYAAR